MNNRRNTPISKPKFASGLLVDSFTRGDNNKLNLQGAFSLLLAWGYPAQRNWNVVVNVQNLQKGISTLFLSIRKKNHKNATTIGFIDVDVKGTETSSLIAAPTAYQFPSEGNYELICQIKGTDIKTYIPFEVKTLDWPIYTKEEIAIANSGKAPITNIRANIHCNNCSFAYIFEESVLNDSVPAQGVIRFSESGKFACHNCDHDMNLKDIQGQLRASLKELLKKSVGGL